MTPHVAAIVNPRSGGGRTGRGWRLVADALQRELGPVRTHFTAGPSTPHFLPAADLTRKALKEGAQLVIAVGGDGTISEVVNGFFENGEVINPDAHLAILNAGTGGDFRRTFDLPDETAAGVARIASGNSRRVDIGRLSFIAEDGTETVRYFDNIASFGISGEVVRAVNKATWPKLFGGAFAFTWSTLVTAATHKPQPVLIRTDTGFEMEMNAGLVAICNGRWFGGGMQVAPMAEPDDGMFEIIMMRDTRLSDMLKHSGAMRDGSHLSHEKVSHIRAKWLEARPVGAGPLLLDVDGEAPGRLPARFEIIPSAITLRC